MLTAQKPATLVDADRSELGVFRIASPCREPWSKMKGDDRVRRCARCNLDVANIDALTTQEARDVLKRASCGERVCVRFYRRFDGTVLTQDCEGGLRAAWREAKRRRARSPALAAFGYLGIVLVTVWLVAVVLFGDQLRWVLGMRADGGLAGIDTVPTAPARKTDGPPEMMRMMPFDNNNAY